MSTPTLPPTTGVPTESAARTWQAAIEARDIAIHNIPFGGFIGYAWDKDAQDASAGTAVQAAAQISYERAYASTLVTQTEVPAWTGNDGSSSWADYLNWTGGLPSTVNPPFPLLAASNPNLPKQTTANFFNAPANTVITLDGSQSITQLAFSGAFSYTITPGTGGSLTMTGAGASVSVSGSHVIAVPMVLASNTGVTVAHAAECLDRQRARFRHRRTVSQWGWGTEAHRERQLQRRHDDQRRRADGRYGRRALGQLRNYGQRRHTRRIGLRQYRCLADRIGKWLDESRPGKDVDLHRGCRVERHAECRRHRYAGELSAGDLFKQDRDVWGRNGNRLKLRSVLQHQRHGVGRAGQAQVGTITVTAASPKIITGGTMNLTGNVFNVAPVNSDFLSFTVAASGMGFGSSATGSVAPAGSGDFTLAAGFNSASLQPGRYTGTVTVTGTNGAIGGQALSSGGSQAVTITVLDHAAAAFADGSGTLNLSFGTVHRGSGTQSLQYQIENLSAAYRAGLDLDSVTKVSDPAAVFSTDAASFADIVPGYTSNPFDLFLNTSQTGQFSGIFQFNLSDEKDLIGHAGQQTLTLDVTADVVPEPDRSTRCGSPTAAAIGAGPAIGAAGACPCAPQDTAVFAASLGGGSAAVNMDIPVTLAGLAFSTTGGDSYVISSSSGMTMTLANTSGAATIDNGGSNAIAAALTLGSSLRLNVAAGSELTIAANISESGGGQSLSLAGGGTLVLSGSSGYCGGTIVESGTLVAANSEAIADGTQRVRRVGFVGVPHGGSSSHGGYTSARAGHVRRSLPSALPACWPMHGGDDVTDPPSSLRAIQAPSGAWVRTEIEGKGP